MSNQLLTVEEELSLAYLHAVCARASVNCVRANRALDNEGIDATLQCRIPEAQYPRLEDSWLDVQLKATKKKPKESPTHYSYWLNGRERYEKLTSFRGTHDRILVVLFLPDDPADWLRHNEKRLVLRRCAYWTSLYEGPGATGETGSTVLFRKSRLLSPDNLRSLMLRLSMGERLKFEAEDTP